TLVNSRKYVERSGRNPDATPEYIRRKAPEVIEFGARTMQRALELGVPVAMGTDAGMFGHGDNAAEIVTMVEAGMTPMQALVATTATAACCIGLGDEVGTIEAGSSPTSSSWPAIPCATSRCSATAPTCASS